MAEAPKEIFIDPAILIRSGDVWGHYFFTPAPGNVRYIRADLCELNPVPVVEVYEKFEDIADDLLPADLRDSWTFELWQAIKKMMGGPT